MTIPDIPCKIEASCDAEPSEDPEKVVRAVSNILPFSEVSHGGSQVRGTSADTRSLEKVREAVVSARQQGAFARSLRNNSDGRATWLLLNKQAAFAGKVAICNDAAESPLGPIRLGLSSPQLDVLVGWLCSDAS